MSIGSTDYKYLKYVTNNASANHPSHYDRDLDSSISSFESLHAPPSKTQSATESNVTTLTQRDTN